tara:strand:+ start:589 stop:1308 length:720 start_codon:yes stop_codon:yes gene_type:complete
MGFIVHAIVGTALITGYFSNKASKRMNNTANAQAAEQLAFQKQQSKLLEKQKAIYREFEFSNPYSNMENTYANMENTMEDMTVSTQAAEFQLEQGAQQRANIMSTLKDSAGGSGIAALAQSLANSGVLQASQVSSNIAQQEQQNAMARNQQAGQIQAMERQGASAADMAQRGGDAMVQQAEMARQSTLLGIEYGGMAGANAGVQSAYANQMSAQNSSMQMQMSNLNALSNNMTNYLINK